MVCTITTCVHLVQLPVCRFGSELLVTTYFFGLKDDTPDSVISHLKRTKAIFYIAF